MGSRWKHSASMYGAEGITREGCAVIKEHGPLWRKRKLISAVRIVGPFSVETREGVLSSPDGYLVVDSAGWPFPVNRDEFEALYEPVDVEEEDD